MISNLNANPGDTNATISWTTDVESTSLVEYGNTSDLAYSATEDSLALIHTVTLGDLQPGTKYYYKVTSTGASGNPASADGIFTTTGTSDTGESDLGEAEFTVVGLDVPAVVDVWDTAEVKVSVKNDGGVNGTYAAEVECDNVAVTADPVDIAAGETKVISIAVGPFTEGPSCVVEVEGTDLSDELSINEGVLPVVAEGNEWVYDAVIDDTSLTVTAKVTDTEKNVEGTDCYVVEMTYDEPLWGRFTGGTAYVDKNTTFFKKIEWSGTYLDLVPITHTIDYTYSSGASELYPLTLGKEFTVEETVAATSSVNVPIIGIPIPLSSASETKTYRYEVGEEMETVTMDNAGTFRCFKVVKIDDEANVVVNTTWISDAAKWIVKQEDGDDVPVQELQYVDFSAASSGDESDGETAGDTTAPTISDISVDEISSTSFRITWVTDEEATSQVEYYSGTSSLLFSDLDSTYKTNHSVVLDGLQADDVYYYEIVSVDAAGNEGRTEGVELECST
jgi:hypothetical protein